jgi:chromosomal replication initiator protein
MTVEDLLARKRAVARRRQVAMWVAHQLTGRSYPFIANKMGGRDHTTVLHGVRAVQALLDAGDAETVEAVNAIVESVKGGH